MVEASHEDAAADADSVGAVDDHGVALDAALRIGRADGERDFPDLQARVDVHRRGFALVSAGVSGAVRASPRVVYADAARRHGGFVVVAALAGVVVAGSAGVDVEAAGDAILEALERAGEDDAFAVLTDTRRAGDLARVRKRLGLETRPAGDHTSRIIRDMIKKLRKT